MDLGADRTPEMFLRVLNKYITYFTTYDLARSGSRWRFRTNIVPTRGYLISPNYKWFLSVSFEPLEDGTKAHTVSIFQEQHVNRSHCIGEGLRTFFRRFGYKTRLYRSRGNGAWDDNLGDDDYVPKDSSDSDDADSDSDDEFPCPTCGYDSCAHKRCYFCQLKADSCICGESYTGYIDLS